MTNSKLNKNKFFLQKINNLIVEHLNSCEFNNRQLARKMEISESQLFRKIKKLTNQSITLYVRSVRLQIAKELLLNSLLNISEVAYLTGFRDPSYFSRIFLKEFGNTPSRIRK